MKDMNLGAFGITALILVLMAKWIAFERLISSGSAIYIISRSMMVELITTLPSARSGEGMAGSFVEGATSGQRIICHLFGIVLSLALGPFGLALYVLAFIISRIYRRQCLKQFGGITGDLLGTANELIVICLLFICAFPGSSILNYTGWAWIR